MHADLDIKRSALSILKVELLEVGARPFCPSAIHGEASVGEAVYEGQLCRQGPSEGFRPPAEREYLPFSPFKGRDEVGRVQGGPEKSLPSLA